MGPKIAAARKKYLLPLKRFCAITQNNLSEAHLPNITSEKLRKKFDIPRKMRRGRMRLKICWL